MVTVESVAIAEAVYLATVAIRELADIQVILESQDTAGPQVILVVQVRLVSVDIQESVAGQVTVVVESQDIVVTQVSVAIAEVEYLDILVVECQVTLVTQESQATVEVEFQATAVTLVLPDTAESVATQAIAVVVFLAILVLV